MKILMLCTKFSLSEDDPWLTNELAESLRERGNEVTVVCLDWAAKAGDSRVEFKTSSGVRVVSLPPVLVRSPISFVSRVLKWSLSSFAAYANARRLDKQEKFDVVIAYSPSTTMALPIMLLAGLTRVTSLLIQWDFFPHHHRQIGLMSSSTSFLIARKVEEMLIRKFDVIACMSPANVNYLRKHYPLRDDQSVCVLPVWGKSISMPAVDRTVMRKTYELPEFRPLIVFGGQLVHGRGLEDLLATAKLAHERSSTITFLIIGSGSLESLVEAYIAQGYDNLVWIPRIPRAEYLGVIKSCDIALVCTVRDVDVPSFPSKTIDYLRVGLPIVASVESTTDYGEYLTSLGVGISVEAGEPLRLLEAIEGLLGDGENMRSMSVMGPERFDSIFEVGHVAKQLTELVELRVSTERNI